MSCYKRDKTCSQANYIVSHVQIVSTTCTKQVLMRKCSSQELYRQLWARNKTSWARHWLEPACLKQKLQSSHHTPEIFCLIGAGGHTHSHRWLLTLFPPWTWSRWKWPIVRAPAPPLVSAPTLSKVRSIRASRSQPREQSYLSECVSPPALAKAQTLWWLLHTLAAQFFSLPLPMFTFLACVCLNNCYCYVCVRT